MLSELPVHLLLTTSDDGLLERAACPLDGVGVVRRGEAMLDVMLTADVVEQVQSVAMVRPLQL